MIPRLSDELALASLLKSRGVQTAAFDGLTTPDQRKMHFRAAIALNGLEEAFRERFREAYGESL
jgi:hypothetical protein